MYSNIKLIKSLTICLLLACLFISGCEGGTYLAEKRHWHATKKLKSLLTETENPTKEDYKPVIDAFREITIRHPRWINTPKVHFQIGQLYEAQGDFQMARKEYGVIKKNFSLNPEISSAAQFKTALTYLLDANWPSTKEEFDKLTKDYPDTKSALQVPIFIAKYYKKIGKEAESEDAYDDALKLYSKKIITFFDKTDPKIIFAADFALECYIDRERWEEAISYLDDLISEYPKTVLAPKSLLAAGLISQTKLEDNEKAVKYFDRLIEEYPKSSFSDAAKKQKELIN